MLQHLTYSEILSCNTSHSSCPVHLFAFIVHHSAVTHFQWLQVCNTVLWGWCYWIFCVCVCVCVCVRMDMLYFGSHYIFGRTESLKTSVRWRVSNENKEIHRMWKVRNVTTNNFSIKYLKCRIALTFTDIYVKKILTCSNSRHCLYNKEDWNCLWKLWFL